MEAPPPSPAEAPPPAPVPPAPENAPQSVPLAAEDPPPVANVEVKATALLLLLLALITGTVLYVMAARGAFEPTQELVLVATDSEGVVVGMDLTFSGFPIGRVRRIELATDGNARILVDVPRKDAHWLRTTSVFTLVRGLVGNTAIRAYSGILTDPPLPPGAVRNVLIGDATAEIPQVIASAKELMQNLNRLSASDSALQKSLDSLQTMTARLNAPQGALGALLGNDADAKKLIVTVDRANALLARLDGLTARADQQLFGDDGLARDVRASVRELNQLLGEARSSLKKVDAVLADAQVVAGNAKVATADLGALRAEVESSLRKVEQLVNEVNRRWPFARQTEIKLP
ncbi:mammalian cell entry protein [Aquincola sp. S2]|uniref:Mammalian cell entry protein n=1 Tax=Pseudaquabacterium terrae TaxID=2732868 RepID=A0ABX2EIF9_9BURK|nr:mammalian cell entry protein [Aquabacterium terrae]NRF68364.1 mammalian cell entry protein [Aquabacterium terrae]